MALPGAQVFVQKSDGQPDAATLTETSSQGRFRISSLAPGTYNVCAAKRGFATACSSIALLGPNSVVFRQPISLPPVGAVIRGCVTLKDGQPAARGAVSQYQSAAFAEVSAVDRAGGVLAGPVRVNAAGCYVLPSVPVIPDVNVSVRYEDAAVEQPLSAYAPPSLQGTVANVVLPVTPPKITAFTASLDGKAVSEAPPGATVTVTVEAVSPNGFPLHYRWADSTAVPFPRDQPTQQWRLPRTNSRNLLFVAVSDGHGGVAQRALSVSTGPVSGDALGPRPAPVAVPPTGLPERLNMLNSHRGSFIDAPDPPDFLDPALMIGFAGGCTDSNLAACDKEAQAYYQALGIFDANNNPQGSFKDFGTWKAAWGFSNDPTKPNIAEGEIRAVYYNNGDLQFGRDMHCLAKSGLADPATVFTPLHAPGLLCDELF